MMKSAPSEKQEKEEVQGDVLGTVPFQAGIAEGREGARSVRNAWSPTRGCPTPWATYRTCVTLMTSLLSIMAEGLTGPVPGRRSPRSSGETPRACDPVTPPEPVDTAGSVPVRLALQGSRYVCDCEGGRGHSAHRTVLAKPSAERAAGTDSQPPHCP